MDVDALRGLYRHMEWADALVWSTVAASEPARSDGKVRDLLHHTHLVQHAFLRTWRGEPRDTPFPTFDALDGLRDWGRTFHGQASAHLATLSNDSLGAPMPLAWAALVERRLGRTPAMTTVGDTVLQVALHSVHHRGQANMRLREIGATPPLVDYIAWVWYGRPAADWPASIG